MQEILERLIEKLENIVEEIKDHPIKSIFVVVVFVVVIKWIKNTLVDN